MIAVQIRAPSFGTPRSIPGAGSAPNIASGNFPRPSHVRPNDHRMPFHDRPIFPRGFRCASRNCGLKPTAKDLALFVSDVDAAAAAVFTRNQFPGAPVLSAARRSAAASSARSSRTAR